MAASPKKQLVLDADLLLDLAEAKDFTHDFKDEFQALGYEFLVPPTAAAELNILSIDLRQHPHLAARLRQNVSPAEATVALQALIRRDEFDPADRIELFAELAAHFQAKVAFPPEATDGIADEQYLRNVVDVIYRTREENRGARIAA
jgi:hypothetical protein